MVPADRRTDFMKKKIYIKKISERKLIKPIFLLVFSCLFFSFCLPLSAQEVENVLPVKDDFVAKDFQPVIEKDKDPIYDMDVIDAIRVFPEDGREPYTITAKNSLKKADKEYKEIIELREPDRQTFAIDEDTREVRIYPAPQFIYISGGEWNYIDYATTSDNIMPADNIAPVSLLRRIFPVAYASESYIVGGGDGAVQGRSQTSFSDARTDVHFAYNGNTEITLSRSEKISANTYWYINRGFLPFNTAGLTGTIQGASLHIYNVAKSNSNNNSLALVQTTQADTSTLTSSDYTLCGSVNVPSEGATRVALSNIYDNAYFEIPLNSTGLSWIDPVGWTKLGVRMSSDIDQKNVPGAGQDNSIYVRLSEYAGTDYDPYLSISISSTTPSTSGDFFGTNQFIFAYFIFGLVGIMTYLCVLLAYTSARCFV